MTVNEMIRYLEIERKNGHGDKEVKIWIPGDPPYWRDVLSLIYRPLRPEGTNSVEIV